jgi:hypothetical protein
VGSHTLHRLGLLVDLGYREQIYDFHGGLLDTHLLRALRALLLDAGHVSALSLLLA